MSVLMFHNSQHLVIFNLFCASIINQSFLMKVKLTAFLMIRILYIIIIEKNKSVERWGIFQQIFLKNSLTQTDIKNQQFNYFGVKKHAPKLTDSVIPACKLSLHLRFFLEKNMNFEHDIIVSGELIKFLSVSAFAHWCKKMFSYDTTKYKTKLTIHST